jgi:hypothetical protein
MEEQPADKAALKEEKSPAGESNSIEEVIAEN